VIKQVLLTAPMLAAAMSLSSLANADVISQTLGGVDFTDGQMVGTGTFNMTNASQPAPFNAFIGSDLNPGPNFSANWAFNYGSIAGTITQATLQIGLLDGDFRCAWKPSAKLHNRRCRSYLPAQHRHGS
jgi:hypothetical protein